MSELGKYLWLRDLAYPVHWPLADRDMSVWEEGEVKIIPRQKIKWI